MATKAELIQELLELEVEFDPKSKKKDLELLLAEEHGDDEETDDEPEAEAPTTGGISAKELAAQFGTDAKALRRWLRSITKNRAGKGHRWVFDKDTVAELTTLWEARNAGTEPELDDEAEEIENPMLLELD